MVDRSEVLFIGGRAGVGKTSLAAELHHQLSAAQVKHAVIEGDNLDLAYPPPWEYQLAEKNLAAIWENYRALGYHRLIYSNTASVLYTADLASAMSDNPVITAVLLTSSDDAARVRLGQREIGTALQQHLERSKQRAAELDQHAPAWVHRINTDGRTVSALAAEVLKLLGWDKSL
ncbi:hypothetical protein [Deinococcus sp.]|uniref:hypothetical protein n=1 Tax=Deinococcus sp. TaxID=47478 RepID=UPI003B58C50C